MSGATTTPWWPLIMSADISAGHRRPMTHLLALLLLYTVHHHGMLADAENVSIATGRAATITR